jgi:hypothetical protein
MTHYDTIRTTYNTRTVSICAGHSGRAVWALIARALGSWVRTLLKAWMFVRVFLLCCPVQVEALRRADSPSKESYQMFK